MQSYPTATPWTVAYEAPLSTGFSRQEYWSGLPFPSPGDLPNPGIEPGSPALQTDALPSEPPGKQESLKNLLKIQVHGTIPRNSDLMNLGQRPGIWKVLHRKIIWTLIYENSRWMAGSQATLANIALHQLSSTWLLNMNIKHLSKGSYVKEIFM